MTNAALMPLTLMIRHSPAPNSSIRTLRFVHDEGSCRESAPAGRGLRAVAPLAEFAMFALFERLLKPTAIARQPGAAARADRVLLAFRPPGEAAVRRRCSSPASSSRCSTRTIPVFIGRVVTLVTTSQAGRRCSPSHWPLLLGMALVLLVAAAGRAHDAEPARQPGDRRQRLEPHPLAEPLACGAAVLGVLPERFRRPHRQPRDADRPGDPREPRRADHRASGTSWSTAPAR